VERERVFVEVEARFASSPIRDDAMRGVPLQQLHLTVQPSPIST
jgi:hypothetical protein